MQPAGDTRLVGGTLLSAGVNDKPLKAARCEKSQALELT